MPTESLIPSHGRYKKLRTYWLGNLFYDATAQHSVGSILTVRTGRTSPTADFEEDGVRKKE